MGEQKAPAVGSSLSKAETHWQRKPVLTTSCGRGGSLLSLQKLYDHTQWPSQTLAALPVVIIPWELIRFLTQERAGERAPISRRKRIRHSCNSGGNVLFPGSSMGIPAWHGQSHQSTIAFILELAYPNSSKTPMHGEGGSDPLPYSSQEG